MVSSTFIQSESYVTEHTVVQKRVLSVFSLFPSIILGRQLCCSQRIARIISNLLRPFLAMKLLLSKLNKRSFFILLCLDSNLFCILPKWQTILHISKSPQSASPNRLSTSPDTNPNTFPSSTSPSTASKSLQVASPSNILLDQAR